MHRPAWTLLILSPAIALAALACGQDPSGDSAVRGGGDSNRPSSPGPSTTAGTSASFDASNPTMQPSERPPLEPVLDMDRCTSIDIQTRRVTPDVMLVVDGSESMSYDYGTASAPDAGMANPVDRWSAMRDALVGPDGVVMPLHGLVEFGLALFATQGGSGTCPLPFGIVAPELENFDAIASGLPTTPPGRFTPAGAALAQVVQMLPDPTMATGEDSDPQVIILATDGEPNDCQSFQTNFGPSITAAQTAQQKNHKLYVISVAPASDDPEAQDYKNHLQELANIGAGMDRAADPGADVFYPENPQALADTLSTLIGAELSCEVALEGKGIRPGKECDGTVILGTGMDDEHELVCEGDNPDFVLTDSHTITLQGQACETYKTSPTAVLSAMFPCDAIIE